MSAGRRVVEPGIVGDDGRESYREKGYLLVEQVVPEGFLVGVQELLESLVEDTVSGWRDAELLTDDHAELGFASRYHRAWLAAGEPRRAPTSDDERFSARTLAGRVSQDWLLGVVAQALGVERVTTLDSCFYRAKFPHDERTSLPWHQDAQCLEPFSGIDFVTAWIPLSDVTEESSCLEVSPVAEDQRVFEPTWSERSGYVCMQQSDVDRLSEVHAVCMRRGDVLLLGSRLPHRSLDNTTTEIRWSVDLRYAPIGPDASPSP